MEAGAEQLNLFTEVDEHVEVDPPAPGEPVGTPTLTRRPGRNPLPAHFPLEIEMVTPGGEGPNGEGGQPVIEGPIAPDDLDAVVQRDGYDLLGYETSERVVYRPGQYVRVLQRRPRYRCRKTGKIVVAHARDRVLARSVADETLGADVVVRKFLDHQPLYRQARALRRDHAWALSPATMGKWVERIAVTLRPLYRALLAQVTAAEYVQMDESTIRVMSADKPGATHQGWMWLVRDPGSGAVAFQYDRGRASAVPRALLDSFAGVIQTDGYGAYAKALKALRAGGAEITHVGCLAHVRRKFHEAKDADPRAREALRLIAEIYRLEAQWRGHAPAARQRERDVFLRPAFAAFGKWLGAHEQAAIPKTALGKALGYARSQWPTLAAVLEDGRLEVDNNGIEREVRPLALGRKNYLFAGNHGAAENIAVLYSLLLTCKAQGVNPRAWLVDTLQRILTHPINRITELLPSNYKARTQDGVG